MRRTGLNVLSAVLVASVGLAVWHPADAVRAREPVAEKARDKTKQAERATAPRPTKLDLTPHSFSELHALIRPHDHEWRHLKVQWLTDVVAVRKKAAAEDKPIVILYTGGAGYNEPLGVC